MYTPVNPKFTINKWGARVYKSHGRVILMYSSLSHNGCISACILAAEDINLDIHIHNGDKSTQNFHFGRYIVGYTVGSFDLR